MKGLGRWHKQRHGLEKWPENKNKQTNKKRRMGNQRNYGSWILNCPECPARDLEFILWSLGVKVGAGALKGFR